MKFLKLLLIVAPALFTTSQSASALPTRGPLITVPGNFSAVSHQEAEYEGIVQRLKKAQSSGNTTDVKDALPGSNGSAVNLTDSNVSANSTAQGGNSTVTELSSAGNSTTELSGAGNSTAMQLPMGEGTSASNSTVLSGNSTAAGPQMTSNTTTAQLSTGNSTDSDPAPSSNSTATALPSGNSTVEANKGSADGASVELPAGNSTLGDVKGSSNSNITSNALPEATSSGNTSSSAASKGAAAAGNATSILASKSSTVGATTALSTGADQNASNATSTSVSSVPTVGSSKASKPTVAASVTASANTKTAKATKSPPLSTSFPPKPKGHSSTTLTEERTSSTSKAQAAKKPSKTTSAAVDASESSVGPSGAVSADAPDSTNTAAPGPEGGRDRWTAAPYGKNSTSTSLSGDDDTAGKSNTTGTATTSSAASAATTIGSGNSTTVVKGNNKANGTTTIDHGDDGTVVISWLANGPTSKGGSPTCSVSIKSHGANGTEISTDGLPSANVTSQTNATADQDSQSAGVQRCATVGSISRTREANTRNLVAQKMKQLKKQHNHAKNTKSGDLRHALAAQNITIPVVFHVITDGEKGNVSDADIGKQMDVLNQDYKDYGFAFTRNSTNRVNNATWFSGASYGGDVVYEMKTALRQGGADTLNVYTVDFQDGVLGFATFPWDYEDSPKEDGIVVQYSTLPGGSLEKYNLGKTTTHEAGHFLGLYHTFGPSGCASPGDFVDDTPPSASPTSGCPARRDSCKGDNLDDPIHNYMDYSTDDCLTEFTVGQAVRMQTMTGHYRLGQNMTTTS